MEYRTTPFNLSISVLLVCLCCIPAAAADDGTSIPGEIPRSFADVPSWITAGTGIKTSADGGYTVNEPLPEYLGGFSDINRADSARDASEVPAWIPAAAGISGLAVLALAAFQFLPILIGRTREVSPSPVRDGVLAAIRETPGCSTAVLREKPASTRQPSGIILRFLKRNSGSSPAVQDTAITTSQTAPPSAAPTPSA